MVNVENLEHTEMSKEYIPWNKKLSWSYHPEITTINGIQH